MIWLDDKIIKLLIAGARECMRTGNSHLKFTILDYDGNLAFENMAPDSEIIIISDLPGASVKFSNLNFWHHMNPD